MITCLYKTAHPGYVTPPLEGICRLMPISNIDPLLGGAGVG